MTDAHPGEKPMIRITGGEFKGRKLKSPEGWGTRPTPSRVRESLFDVLGDSVEGREFYDLYAGCGAVGFEALSRAARRVVFVESSRRAVAALRANVAMLDARSNVRVVVKELPHWLQTEEFAPEPPVVVFADPPYREGLAEKTLAAIAERSIDWGSESVCVVQAEKECRLVETCGHWALRKCYVHGDSALWVYDPAASG
ncbi:16S rRNA (guanine(966)-N(2))-methyltransferase RsmD [Candidatus Sumerlaeota bacterium]|nr:16S rRNA (guanine(966)-N(2))-methyltransferase RsmD [Candidatus Sumerlaeota bacterium]